MRLSAQRVVFLLFMEEGEREGGVGREGGRRNGQGCLEMY